MNNVVNEELKLCKKKYGKMDDKALIDEIVSGKDEGKALFYLIYGRYNDTISYAVQKVMFNQNLLEDLYAELEFHLYKENCKALKSFNFNSSFPTWLSHVAENLFRDKLIYYKGNPDGDVEINDSVVDEDDNEKENIDLMVRCINNMRDRDKSFVLLKTLEGFNADEIAELLTLKRRNEGRLKQSAGCDFKINADYVYNLKSRAILKLKTMMEELREEENQRISIKMIPNYSAPCAPKARRFHETNLGFICNKELYDEPILESFGNGAKKFVKALHKLLKEVRNLG